MARISSLNRGSGGRVSERSSLSLKRRTSERASHKSGAAKDYRYLSNVAHGSPLLYLVHTYAQRGVVSLHDDRHVPALLLTGASYAVLGTAIWNEAYRLIPDPQLEALAAQIGAISAPQRRENGGDETEAGGA